MSIESHWCKALTSSANDVNDIKRSKVNFTTEGDTNPDEYYPFVWFLFPDFPICMEFLDSTILLSAILIKLLTLPLVFALDCLEHNGTTDKAVAESVYDL
jgi:hypothetical protein